jgi:hypothetical protein
MVVPSFSDFISGNFDPSQFEGYDISETISDENHQFGDMMNAKGEKSSNNNKKCVLKSLVLGTSNCCDVIGFLKQYFKSNLSLDTIDCYGQQGIVVSRLHDMNKYFNLNLTSCNYVSMDCNTFSTALKQLEADGEAPIRSKSNPSRGRGSGGGGGDALGNENESKDNEDEGYHAVFLDWSTECGEMGIDNEHCWKEFETIITIISPWLHQSEGVFSIGLGPGSASSSELRVKLKNISEGCGLKGFRLFSDLVHVHFFFVKQLLSNIFIKIFHAYTRFHCFVCLSHSYVLANLDK